VDVAGRVGGGVMTRKVCDDGGVMIVTVAAVRKVMVSPVESSRVHWTPPDSTGLEFQWSPVDWPTGLDYSPAVLSGSAMDLADHSVRRSPTGLCGGEIRTRSVEGHTPPQTEGLRGT